MCKCSRTSSEMLFNLTVVFVFAFYVALSIYHLLMGMQVP